MTRAAVLGASGYSGGVVVRLLAGHPTIDVTFVGARGSAGAALGASHPHLASTSAADLTLAEMQPAAIVEAADLVFSALPHGVFATLAPSLLDAGLLAIDLAGDFRLTAESYPEWYGFEHPAPELLPTAVYGLPEVFGELVGGATLVANPGCYPTPVILGCAPLLSEALIEPGPIRVDGKTGLSGAGRGATEAALFTSTEDSVRPYRLPAHQHTPEMERGLELATRLAPPVIFVPHLVPTVRGVVTTCYADLAEGVTTDRLTQALAAAYEGRPFVRVLPPGGMVDSKRTRGTNVVELQAVADPRTGTAIVVGAVDNLVKGAAGQAIQNANLLLGLSETTGLPTLAVYP